MRTWKLLRPKSYPHGGDGWALENVILPNDATRAMVSRCHFSEGFGKCLAGGTTRCARHWEEISSGAELGFECTAWNATHWKYFRFNNPTLVSDTSYRVVPCLHTWNRPWRKRGHECERKNVEQVGRRVAKSAVILPMLQILATIIATSSGLQIVETHLHLMKLWQRFHVAYVP